jgi:hypothetical protein
MKKIGRTYGKEINVKTATVNNLFDGLRSGDTLIKEIVQNHIGIQNPEQFVNISWRHYTGK